MSATPLHKPTGNRVLLGLSGNMLSSVVAALLKHQGFQVLGIHYKTDDRSQAEAERISHKLGISLVVEDVAEEIQHFVTDHIVHERLSNHVPEPEAMGHQRILIDRLCAKAKEIGCAKIATGHAARVALDPSTGLTRLLRSSDSKTDQSHLLFGLSAQALKQFILPVGDLGPGAVERLAIELELDPIKLKSPPPGFCAIAEEEFAAIVESKTPIQMKSVGQIKTAEGTVVGEHEGLYKYVRGQHKGLPVPREKLHDFVVVDMDPATQTLIIGSEELLKRSDVVIKNANWIQAMDPIKGRICEARLSADTWAKCQVTEFEFGYLHVQFTEPQKNIRPGRSIVFYTGDEVLGGGFAV